MYTIYHWLICDCAAGSPLCWSDVVDAGQGGAQNEGYHLQGAPMGGHAWSVLLQGPWRGKAYAAHHGRCTCVCGVFLYSVIHVCILNTDWEGGAGCSWEGCWKGGVPGWMECSCSWVHPAWGGWLVWGCCCALSAHPAVPCRYACSWVTFNTSSLFRNCNEIVVPNLSLNFCFYFLTAAPAVKTGEVYIFFIILVSFKWIWINAF